MEAHPGRRAADGCHKETATGERHCHDNPASEPKKKINIKTNKINKINNDVVVIEDKSNPAQSVLHEFQPNEIFKASDVMVDALTRLLDQERNKRKAS